jgi:hypothetical protein
MKLGHARTAGVGSPAFLGGGGHRALLRVGGFHAARSGYGHGYTGNNDLDHWSRARYRWLHHPIADVWTTKAPLLMARARHAAGVIQNAAGDLGLMAVGGAETVEAYTP